MAISQTTISRRFSHSPCAISGSTCQPYGTSKKVSRSRGQPGALVSSTTKIAPSDDGGHRRRYHRSARPPPAECAALQRNR